jgi:hypothetical protein
VERRRWIRYFTEQSRCTLSWDEGANRNTGDAVLLTISGNGAALLTERSPEVGQIVYLHLDSGSAATAPVEARTVGVAEHPSGQRLVRIRFTIWDALKGLFGHLQERRLWKRDPVRETRAVLTWTHEGREKMVQAELLNISGGGAAVLSPIEPPFDRSIWFGLETEDPGIEPVESQVCGILLDPSVSRVVRLLFLDPCPMALFELAVGLWAGGPTSADAAGTARGPGRPIGLRCIAARSPPTRRDPSRAWPGRTPA